MKLIKTEKKINMCCICGEKKYRFKKGCKPVYCVDCIGLVVRIFKSYLLNR